MRGNIFTVPAETVLPDATPAVLTPATFLHDLGLGHRMLKIHPNMAAMQVCIQNLITDERCYETVRQ